jgi:hypothetical protein
MFLKKVKWNSHKWFYVFILGLLIEYIILFVIIGV